ncbi:helix-turn-helix domain-containing protein [Nocardioides sp. NPDC051685]|uniref:helix-turn-helix domain-containing protein n=1 Tax=Nocardioides sp. NPDC051685 TaxID=3364334 RepID=UPI0037A33536
MLDALGLDKLEETVYRQLVGAPSANLEELAEVSDLDTYAVSAVLAALEGKGLVARASAGQDRYVASPPAVALGALLVQRQDELRRAQVEMTELAGLYRGSVARRDVADVVDVVHGTEAIAQRFAQLQYSAKKCIQALQKPQAAVVTREDADEAERAAIERGVRHDIVLERSVFDTPGIYETIDSGLEIGIELRVVPTVPLRAFIVDREIALIPLMNSEHNTVQDALLLHPSGLLDAILALFDLIWTSAPKLVATPEGTVETAADRLEPLDTKVLSLLLAGLTDASIGAQLGLSLRTVQRRVRQMMDRARVDTRLQLGYEAGRRGWL